MKSIYIMTSLMMCTALTACTHLSSASLSTTSLSTTSKTPSTNASLDTAQPSTQHVAPEQGYELTEQRLVHANKFMVASANPLATKAGYDILAQGGSAVDAMIAVQTTLSLVEPQSSGLGGGAFVVYWDNDKKRLTTFDGRETAPMAVDEALFMKEGKAMGFMDAVVGGRSVGVPAVPLLMRQMHERYGKLSWGELFGEPIRLAKDGFVVSPRMASSIKSNEQSLSKHKTTADYFLPNGKPLQAGEILVNPEFADTVETLATQGVMPFYHGKYAQNIVQVVNDSDNKGSLTMADFGVYQVIERQPVCVDYRQYQVCGMGAPSSGGIALGQIVGVLNHFSPSELAEGQAQTLRILGDASRLAFADREQYVADPKYLTVPTQQMLSPDYLSQRAALIKNTHVALAEVQAGKLSVTHAPAPSLELPSTSHISIVDQYGNVLSMTTSIENAFGSTLMANGYLLNNELTDFSFEPTKEGKPVANRVEGGKRPRSSMAPTIVMHEGRPYMAVGSPGGSRIIGYVAKTLVAHVDWGMDIQQAINYPNALNRFGVYELEQDSVASSFNQSLMDLGYKTDIRDLNSGVQGIIITKHGLQGGADPRREGQVMGK